MKTVAVAKRTKREAGKNEVADIANIVTALKERTAAGRKIADGFRTAFGHEILDARARAGNRGIHYDFEILVEGLGWKHIEHKGGEACVPIKPTDRPWTAGVQFHNGGCEKYGIGRLYARTWYDFYIGSGTLKSEWGLDAAIPSFDEWFAKDAKAQADPKTEFGQELKRKVRASGGSLGGHRAAAHAAFQPTAEDLEQFKVESLGVLNQALAEKDYWLTIHGPVTGEFHCAWYPQFLLSAVDSITVRKELDIWFDFRCGDLTFSSILRWGKGAGFSNLRIDAR